MKGQIDNRLMAPGSTWWKHGQEIEARQADDAVRSAYYLKALVGTGEERVAGGLVAMVAHLGLPWLGLCIPHGPDPHETVIEAFNRGRLTLKEVCEHLWSHQ
jgi:hypothetical protein